MFKLYYMLRLLMCILLIHLKIVQTSIIYVYYFSNQFFSIIGIIKISYKIQNQYLSQINGHSTFGQYTKELKI